MIVKAQYLSWKETITNNYNLVLPHNSHMRVLEMQNSFVVLICNPHPHFSRAYYAYFLKNYKICIHNYFDGENYFKKKT